MNNGRMVSSDGGRTRYIREATFQELLLMEIAWQLIRTHDNGSVEAMLRAGFTEKEIKERRRGQS